MEEIKYDEMEIDILNFNNGQIPSSCGYCKVDGAKMKTSYSMGFCCDRMSPDMYEKLMLLGWRRCGDYVYKPDLSRTCCKLYTLRLDVDRFKINKNQRKVMKKFRKYLSGETFNTNIKHDETDDLLMGEYAEDIYLNSIYEFLNNFLSSEEFLYFINSKFEFKGVDFKVYFNNNKKLDLYSSNMIIILFHTLKKASKNMELYDSPSHFYKILFDYIIKYFSSDSSISFRKTWEIAISSETGHINFISNNDEIQQNILKINNSKKKLKKNNKKNKNNTEISIENKYILEYFDEFIKEPIIDKNKLKHNYTLDLEPSSLFTNEKYEIYKKYQIVIHKDKEIELTPERYKSSWGHTNLKEIKIYENPKKSIYPNKLGTYDLIHRIDGKIIAVGVLDILPTCLSSVYLYYDPGYSFLNLGIFTAIREIEFLKELKYNLDSRIQYYCMGFYCHTCTKMKYKGQYNPSQILCPISLKFVDLQSVYNLLDMNKFIALSDENKNDEINLTEQEKKKILNNLNLYYSNKCYNAISFINSINSEKYKKIILKNIQDLIDNVGKNNVKNFKLLVN